MRPDLKLAIQHLLKDYQKLTKNSGAPRDYVTLCTRTLQIELQQELQILENILNESTQFEEHFKDRCAERETDINQSVPFHTLPNSPANELYWKIAELTFQPKTLGEMLNILMPNVQFQLTWDISNYVPIPQEHSTHISNMELKEYARQIEPNLNKVEKKLISAPTLDELSHHAISDTMIFDLREIADLPLIIHANLYKSLQKHYPELAKRIYSHSASFQTLASDIFVVTNTGMTPKKAILELIKGLTLGGSRMTGSEYANPHATIAIARFYEYYMMLPRNIQTHLNNLKDNNNKTLEKVIENEIKKGECVETTADFLKSLLECNREDIVLNTPPTMTTESLKKLENKYRLKPTLTQSENNTILSTRKDAPLLKLPAILAKKALASTTPKTLEDLTLLILNFPPTYYDTLFSSMLIDKKIISDFPEVIRSDIFQSVEQKKSLAQAIVKYHERFDKELPILSWAIETNNDVFLQEAINSFKKDQLIAAIELSTTIDNNSPLRHQGIAPLHLASHYPNLFKIIFDQYPDDASRRQAATNVKDNHGATLFHHSTVKFESFKILGDLFTEDKEALSVGLQTKDLHNRIPLNWAAQNNAESFKNLLTYYPDDQARLKAISENMVLYDAIIIPESLKISLSLYPEAQRLQAVTSHNFSKTKIENVLFIAKNRPESLIAILECLPEKDRLMALNTRITQDTTEDVNTVGMKLAEFYESLPESTLKDSFTFDFIKINAVLQAKPAPTSASTVIANLGTSVTIFQNPVLTPFYRIQSVVTSFYNNDEKSQEKDLTNALKQKQSFDEIKKYLIECISQYPKTDLTKKLLAKLEITPTAENSAIDLLKKRWLTEAPSLQLTNGKEEEK